MILTTIEIQVLKWAAVMLDERADKVERIMNRPSSFRKEAQIIRDIIERWNDEEEKRIKDEEEEID